MSIMQAQVWLAHGTNLVWVQSTALGFRRGARAGSHRWNVISFS